MRKRIRFPGTNGFQRFLSALVLWALFAVPLSLLSASIKTWPSGQSIPWVAAAASVVGVLVSVLIYAVTHSNGATAVSRNVEAPPRRRVTWQVATLFVLGYLLIQILLWVWATGGSMPTVSALGAIACGVLLGLGTFWLFVHGFESGWFRQHAAVVFNWKTTKHVVWGTLGAVFIVCIVVFFLDRLLAGRSREIRSFLAENPGGLFTFVTGLFTLIGVYLALQSLAVTGQNISTFPDMARRLRDLIQATREDDYVRYLCYTPLTGSLALSRPLFYELHDLIQGKSKRIAIVTLNDADLDEWLRKFEGKVSDFGLVEKTEVDTAVNDARSLLKTLEEREDGDRHFKPRRLAYRDMPGFYIFSNSERAIVVSPLSLPPLSGSEEVYKRRLGPVQMVGIETADPDVVARVNALHEFYYKDFVSDSGPREA